MNTLPEDFKPESYSEIPYGYQLLFEHEASPELEKLGREAITAALSKKLKVPVVSRETLNSRYGLKKLGYTADDIMQGRIKIR